MESLLRISLTRLRASEIHLRGSESMPRETAVMSANAADIEYRGEGNNLVPFVSRPVDIIIIVH